MDPLAFHREALDVAQRVVDKIDPSQFELPTPCDEWNVRQVLEHIIGGNRRIAGNSAHEDEDVIGDDLSAPTRILRQAPPRRSRLRVAWIARTVEDRRVSWVTSPCVPDRRTSWPTLGISPGPPACRQIWPRICTRLRWRCCRAGSPPWVAASRSPARSRHHRCHRSRSLRRFRRAARHERARRRHHWCG